MGLSALKIIGYIYTALGSIFVLLGLSLWGLIPEGEGFIIGVIFSGIGSIFLILGIIFLVHETKKLRRANALLAADRYVMGTVANIQTNVNVRVNGFNPYVLLIKCQDAQGNTHIYRSRNIQTYVDYSIIGTPVKVYTEYVGSKEYYVDLDGVLPQVIEH